MLADPWVAVSGLDDRIDISSAVDPGIGGRAGILFLSKEEALCDVSGRCKSETEGCSTSGTVREDDGLSSCSLALRLSSSKPNEKPAGAGDFGPGARLGLPGSKLERNVGECTLSKKPAPLSARALSGGVPGNTGSCQPKVGPDRPENSCETLWEAFSDNFPLGSTNFLWVYEELVPATKPSDIIDRSSSKLGTPLVSSDR